MSETVLTRPEAAAKPTARARVHGPRHWLRNPWRKPRFMEAFTWLYLAWSILPVAIAIMISFNAGRSNSSMQGFGLNWWFGNPQNDSTGSLFHDPELHLAIAQSFRLSITTMLLAVPLGVSFAIGIDR